MIEKHLDIATADGAMNSFVVHPEEGGPHPVVLFYMDAPGKREELHDMARRLATERTDLALAAYVEAGREHAVMAPVYLFHGANICDVIRPGDTVEVSERWF